MEMFFHELTKIFINCKDIYLPFKYLGLLMGDNSRCETTWDPLFKLIAKRFSS